MDREIELPTRASRGRSHPRRRGAARTLVHLAVLAAAAMPLLGLVSWGIVGALRGGDGKVAVAPRPHLVHVAKAAPAFRITAPRPSPLPFDVFAQESRLSPVQLMNRWSADTARASRRFGVPQ